MGAQSSRVAFPQHTVHWYRTKLDADVSARLHQTSDVRGFAQTLGFLGMLLACAALALYCSSKEHTYLATIFVLLYGLQANFLINAMHELGHGFVFKTKWLNSVFLRVVSFLGWLHPDMFFSSHLRHHRYTQNAPHDLENPMPIRITLWDFAAFGFVNIKGCYDILKQTVYAAIGHYPTGHLGWLPGWEKVCYPPDMPDARAPAMLWARALLAGHGAVAVLCVLRGWYLVPVLLSLGPFYNGWLFFLCNATQHVGLHPGVSDFRLNCRTFALHPLVAFWYWHMNWHIEHHMYSAVPCYNLAALHAAIKHDLPPTPNGIVEVWRVISGVLRAQAIDPTFAQRIALPGTPPAAPPTTLIGDTLKAK